MAPRKTATKQANRIRKIIGSVAQKKGRDGESRVLLALQNAQSTWPNWLKSIRKATNTEDKKGCDLVADTDVGQLYLQIKSSQTGVKKFGQRQRKKMIAVMLSKPNMTQSQIASQGIEALGALHQLILERRG